MTQRRRKDWQDFNRWTPQDFLVWKNETSDLFFQIERIRKNIAVLAERSLR